MWLCWALSCLLLTYNTQDETQNRATACLSCVCVCVFKLCVCVCVSMAVNHSSHKLQLATVQLHILSKG